MRTWVYCAWTVKWTEPFGWVCSLSPSEFWVCAHSCLWSMARSDRTGSQPRERILPRYLVHSLVPQDVKCPQKCKLRGSSWHVWDAFYVPGTELSISHILSHLILSVAQRCGYCYQPPFQSWRNRSTVKLWNFARVAELAFEPKSVEFQNLCS